MYSIKLTANYREIKELLRDDYDKVIYDGCPQFEDFNPDIVNSLWFVLYFNEEKAGLIKLEALNNVLWSPHIVIQKKYRGNGSEAWGKLVVDFMERHFEEVAFLIMTPYKAAKKYAEKVGFKHIGTALNSIKKNGRLMNQYVLTGEQK